MATGIRERHGSYEAWVWSVRDGKKIRKTFETFDEAKTWRADAYGAVRKGTMQAPTNATLMQAGEAFIQGARSGVVKTRTGRRYKPSAVRGYDADLRRYVYPDLGALRLSQVARRDLQALVDRLEASGLSGSKVRNIITPVQAIYRVAIRRDELTLNPTVNLELPLVGDPRDRVADPAEARALLDALPIDDRALWATAFFGGLRRGELRGLRCEDVDSAAALIHVRRGWDDVEGAIDPKSRKGARTVPIPDALAQELRAHLLRTGRRGADLIFGMSGSRPFVPKLVRQRALDAWAAVEPEALATITLHECRHTYISLMYAAGCPLEEIGDYVGHSSTYMTDRYRHLLPGQHQRAADHLDALLTGANAGAEAR